MEPTALELHTELMNEARQLRAAWFRAADIDAARTNTRRIDGFKIHWGHPMDNFSLTDYTAARAAWNELVADLPQKEH